MTPLILVDLFYNLNITLVNQVLKKKFDDVDMKRPDTSGLVKKQVITQKLWGRR